MFNTVQDAVLSLLPPKRRRSQSGWLSFNAVCCSHRGESLDTRQRGGVMTQPDGAVSYHCFNCQFKTGYKPGAPLGFKFRRWLKWLGADDAEVNRLVIEALRVKDLVQPESQEPEPIDIDFEPRPLPQEAKSFMALADFYELNEWRNVPTAYKDSVAYVHGRQIDMQRYEFYWTPEVEHKLSHRVIVPFYYKRKIVGWTARALNSGIKPKYHSDHPSNFVFNMDQQQYDSKFVIVCEGVFDALAIDGVAVLGADITEPQAELIESLEAMNKHQSGMIDRLETMNKRQAQLIVLQEKSINDQLQLIRAQGNTIAEMHSAILMMSSVPREPQDPSSQLEGIRPVAKRCLKRLQPSHKKNTGKI